MIVRRYVRGRILKLTLKIKNVKKHKQAFANVQQVMSNPHNNGKLDNFAGLKRKTPGSKAFRFNWKI